MREEDAAALFDAFTLVGEDPEETNLEFACDALMMNEWKR